MQNINLRDVLYCKKQLDLGLIIFSLRYLLEKKCHTPGTLGEGLRYIVNQNLCWLDLTSNFKVMIRCTQFFLTQSGVQIDKCLFFYFLFRRFRITKGIRSLYWYSNIDNLYKFCFVNQSEVHEAFFFDIKIDWN